MLTIVKLTHSGKLTNSTIPKKQKIPVSNTTRIYKKRCFQLAIERFFAKVLPINISDVINSLRKHGIWKL